MTNKDESSAHGSNSLAKSVASVLIPISVVAGLVFYLVGSDSLQPGYTSPTVSADAKAVAVGNRIQKVGTISMGEANRALVSGEEVFKNQCAACHATGAAGAPKFQDAGAWGPRIAQGLPALVNSALKGKNAMGPQGGGNYTDIEIARGVVYMANGAGAKFAEPQAPAAAAGASAPAAAASAASAAK